MNSFHATFTRRTDFRGPNANFFNARDLGINITTLVPNDFRLSVTNGGFNVGCGTCSPAHLNVNTYQFSDDIDLIRGKHHIGFGVDYIRTQNNINLGYLQNGNFAFSGTASGDSILDFLTGTMSGFSQSLPQQPTARMSIPALYVQDVFKLNPHLTINAGLRWEPNLWPYDYHKRGAAFSLANFLNNLRSTVYPNAPAGALYIGDAGIPRSFSNNRYTNFSPRLGLAFDPRGDGRETFRVGAGIMYDYGMLFTAQRLASDPPFVNEIDLNTSRPGGFSNPWTTGYNYPGGNPFPPTGAYFPQYALWIVLPQNLKPTTLYQWNATYQRQFGGNWLASLTYMGNKTAHVWTGQEINPAIYSPSVCAQFTNGCSTGNTSQRKLLIQTNPSQGQYYGNVDILDYGANATYNALLASIQQRLSHGVTFLANYTWSHCISDSDFTGDITGPNYMNPSNRRQVASLVRILSGAPLNITTGTDASLTGVGLDRPNLNQTTAESDTEVFKR